MRAAGITLLSLAMTAGVIGNAFYQKKQFFPSVVYITKSNPSMAVIYLQALVFVILTGKLMQKVFFGQLRAAEFEHLADRSWYAVTETCLAFTVFRDDFSPKFVALFTVLFFLKSFHWLAEDRVDFMERSPVISWLFHIRIVSLMMILGLLDIYFVNHAYQSTLSKGATVQLVFGFEYMILWMIVVNITIKYVLHTIDLHSDVPWDNKAVFLLYTEVAMGFLKVVLYVAFFLLMVRMYTLPLFAFRPMYYTMRSFKKAVNDVILSRRAIQNMNTLYPDATPEELAAADNVCIICREEMVSASKKLPCNHIFHTSCLRSWFQRQQTCPTCRLNILRIPGNNATPPNQPAAAQAAQPNAAEVPPHPPPGMPHPFPNGMFPGMFPFWQQQFNLHQNQQQPQQGAAQPSQQQPSQTAPQQGQSNQTANEGAAQQQAGPSTSTGPQTSAGPSTLPSFPPPFPSGFGFPLFCPPFPPVPPYSVPPPMPPPNLVTMSDEELRRLENSSREGVIARLQCLKNIQLLLDTAVLMMQQYSTAASTAANAMPTSAPPDIPSPSTSSPTSSSTLESNAESQAKSSASDTSVELSAGLRPDASASHSNIEDTSRSDLSCSSSGSVLSSEQEEVRRRRLQKFSNDGESVD